MSVKQGGKSTTATSQSPPVAMQRRRTKVPLQEKKIADDEFMAAAIGDTEWLRQSIRGNRGAVNFDKNGLAPIHLAAIHGRVECLRLLIEKFKVDINLPSTTGWRPIHLCISNQTGKRSFNCLQYLLEHSADPSVINDDGVTPMHQAASEGHVQCLKALIEVGATIDKADHRGHKPIDLAKLWGHRKCARLLAAEQWHQDKDFLAHEMGKLQKMKMQQVLEDIKTDEEIKADQQFYGDTAFKDWLQSRKQQQNASSPGKDKTASGGGDSKAVKQKETLHKANSLQMKASGDSKVKISEELPRLHRSRDSTCCEQKTVTRESENSVNFGLHETKQEAQDNEDGENKISATVKALYHSKDWNKSTKLPQSRFEYTPLLSDHYPRDEYTMKPKHPAQRKAISSNAKKAGGDKRQKNTAISVSQMSEDLEMAERPVVYKCKHIGDVHKKKYYDEEMRQKDEAGLHLCQDPSSGLFQSALLTQETLNTPSTVISGISDWGAVREMKLPSMMGMMQRMNKPNHFPQVSGKEYDVNFANLQCV